MITEMRYLLGLLAVIVPDIAVAECVVLRANVPAQSAALVFSGTATDITANDASEWPSAIITFDVDKVWKGRVTKRFVVYSFTRTAERFTFKIGQAYLVFAHEQTEAERHDLNLGITERQVFVVGQCGDGTREMAMVTPQETMQLGPASGPARPN
jgi:hypothetical protein